MAINYTTDQFAQSYTPLPCCQKFAARFQTGTNPPKNNKHLTGRETKDKELKHKFQILTSILFPNQLLFRPVLNVKTTLKGIYKSTTCSFRRKDLRTPQIMGMDAMVLHMWMKTFPRSVIISISEEENKGKTPKQKRCNTSCLMHSDWKTRNTSQVPIPPSLALEYYSSKPLRCKFLGWKNILYLCQVLTLFYKLSSDLCTAVPIVPLSEPKRVCKLEHSF